MDARSDRSSARNTVNTLDADDREPKKLNGITEKLNTLLNSLKAVEQEKTVVDTAFQDKRASELMNFDSKTLSGGLLTKTSMPRSTFNDDATIESTPSTTSSSGIGVRVGAAASATSRSASFIKAKMIQAPELQDQTTYLSSYRSMACYDAR